MTFEPASLAIQTNIFQIQWNILLIETNIFLIQWNTNIYFRGRIKSVLSVRLGRSSREFHLCGSDSAPTAHTISIIMYTSLCNTQCVFCASSLTGSLPSAKVPQIGLVCHVPTNFIKKSLSWPREFNFLFLLAMIEYSSIRIFTRCLKQQVDHSGSHINCMNIGDI